MSRRVQIVLPDPVGDRLDALAHSAGEPPATLAAEMVRDAVALATTDGKARSSKRTRRLLRGKHGKRAAWLEPYGGDPGWRRQMWGAIVSLHGRYPHALAALKEGWWIDEAQTETLCALAVWRAEIDDACEDPREELAFHAQLPDCAHTWRQEGGGVSKAWKPGAPPTEWGA